MSHVNPPPALRIPKDWFNDREKRGLLEQLNRILFQLWEETQTVEDVEAISNTNFYAQAIVSDNDSPPAFVDSGGDLISTPDQLFQVFEDEMRLGEQSTLNTSTTPLSGGATYTGTAEQNDYSDVMCSCYSDTAGTLYFDFSVNGTDWRTFPASGFVVSAGIHEFHTAVKGPRYFRVRFTNGASAQSTFQLFTYFGTFRQPSAPLNQPLGLDSDAILVRPTFPWMDISRGLTSGITNIEKFGYNENVGSSFEPVCYGGIYQTPTSAVSLEFVSSSTVDALDDTGMHELTVEGLDANYELQTVATAAHATDGLTAVAISGTWTRVFRAYVSSSGTYANSTAGSHAGSITIRVAGGGATYATIPLINSFPIGQSLIGAYSVPIGCTAYVFCKDVTSDTGKTVNYGVFFRDNINDVSSSYSPMRMIEIKTGISGGVIYSGSSAKVPLGPFVGPCDIGYMAYSSGGGGNAVMTVEFEIFLVNE